MSNEVSLRDFTVRLDPGKRHAEIGLRKMHTTMIARTEPEQKDRTKIQDRETEQI